MVDATSFFGFFDSFKFLAEQFNDAVNDESGHTVVNLLMDRIEFSNVILLNKCDMVDRVTLEKAEGLLHKLNPLAEVIITDYSKLPLSKVRSTGLFDFEKASLAPGWLQSLTIPHNPETVVYGIGSFVYRSRQPAVSFGTLCYI